MSYDFQFALVPFKEDGSTHAFQHCAPDPEDLAMEEWEELGQRDLLKMLGFGGNVSDSHRMFPSIFYGIGECLGDLWINFLDGGPLTWDSNGRFIMLEPRREKIQVLRQNLYRLSEPQCLSLTILIDECERMLLQYAKCSSRLALVIH